MSICYQVRLFIISCGGTKLTDVRRVGSIKKQGMLGKIISRFNWMCGCFEGSVLTVVVFSIIGVCNTLYSSNDNVANVATQRREIMPPMQVGFICSGDVLFLK